MQNGEIDFSAARVISPEHFDEWTRKADPQPFDVVLSRRCNPGETALVRPEMKFALGQNLVLLRADGERVRPSFLRWLVRTRHWWNEVERFLNVGAVFDSLRCADVPKFRLPIPPLDVQDAIANILGALDDKIDLNRRMNETLEAMARALFKSWFVNFDPVRAKMEGDQPAHMDAETAALFPDAFDDEGLPVGWVRSPLGGLLSTLETGKRPRGGVANISKGVPSVGAESIVGVGVFDFRKTKYVPRSYFDHMAKGVVRSGDVLIYKDGGKPGELRPAVSYTSKKFPFENFCINEHVFRARSDHFSQQFLYCSLTTEDAFWQMREFATGVAQPGLNQYALKSIKITLPNDTRILQACEELIGPAIDGCNIIALQSKTLGELRDLLLPKLMSGEIRVREAEELVEAVT